MRANACETAKFVSCPRFAAAAESPVRSYGGGLRAREADHTLSWIGVTAVACVIGGVIGALAFVLLPGSQSSANSAYQSEVAGASVTATPQPAKLTSGVLGSELSKVEDSPKTPAAPSPTARPTVPAEIQTKVTPEPTTPATTTSRPQTAAAAGDPAGPYDITHVVQDGETLWDIAAAYGVDLAELATRNGLAVDALVMTGDTLIIPGIASPSSTEDVVDVPTAPEVVLSCGSVADSGEELHLVEEGETLGGIAAEYDVDANDLAERNCLPINALLMMGDILVIPAP